MGQRHIEEFDDGERDDERDDDTGLSDREGPDESDLDDSDDDEKVPCPYCRKPVYEQAELCPHCGSFMSFEDARRRPPLWIWIGVALCLIPVLMWTC